RLGVEPRGGEEPVPEERSARERRADGLVHLPFGSRRPRRTAEKRRVVAEDESHAVEPRSDPDELTGSAELVELLRPVIGHAARQNLSFPEGDRQREPLQRDEGLAERRAAIYAVPAREKAAERRLLHGLHLA